MHIARYRPRITPQDDQGRYSNQYSGTRRIREEGKGRRRR